jgi:CHASE2 domain-containing sensor protein
MMLWIGRTFDHQTEILAGAVTLALVVSITSPYNMFLNAAGKARQQILPWALFLVISVVLKNGLLALGHTWWIPFISAASYLCIITPVVIRHSNRQIHSLLKSENG